MPIVLHIPHASTTIPFEVRAQFPIGEAALQHELLVMTDHLTDELFVLSGSCRIVYPVSRLVVDPERFPLDIDEPMANIGMGAVYTAGHDLSRVRSEITGVERDSLLSMWYQPHHDELAAAVTESLKQHHRAVIVDCHSFASKPLPYEPDQDPDRPEICIGTDSYHTPPTLATTLVDSFKDSGYTVEVDRPYSGAIVPAQHYRSDSRVHSIMIEIRRDLYCDESTGAASAGFDRVREDITRAMLTLRRLE